MDFSEYFYSAPAGEVCDRLRTDPSTGLSSSEAAKRKKYFGMNRTVRTGDTLDGRGFFASVVTPGNVFALFCIVAAVSRHMRFSVPVLVLFILSVLLSAVDLVRYWRTVRYFNSVSYPFCAVLRDSSRKLISQDRLVPGDIVHFKRGDTVCADCRVIETGGLKAADSPADGSQVHSKTAEAVPQALLPSEMTDILFAGNVIVSGTCKAVVLLTGTDTSLYKSGKTAGTSVSNTSVLFGASARRDSAYSIVSSLICLVFGMILLFAAPSDIIPYLAYGALLLAFHMNQTELSFSRELVASSMKRSSALPRGTVMLKDVSQLDRIHGCDTLVTDIDITRAVAGRLTDVFDTDRYSLVVTGNSDDIVLLSQNISGCTVADPSSAGASLKNSSVVFACTDSDGDFGELMRSLEAEGRKCAFMVSGFGKTAAGDENAVFAFSGMPFADIVKKKESVYRAFPSFERNMRSGVFAEAVPESAGSAFGLADGVFAKASLFSYYNLFCYAGLLAVFVMFLLTGAGGGIIISAFTLFPVYYTALRCISSLRYRRRSGISVTPLMFIISFVIWLIAFWLIMKYYSALDILRVGDVMTAFCMSLLVNLSLTVVTVPFAYRELRFSFALLLPLAETVLFGAVLAVFSVFPVKILLLSAVPALLSFAVCFLNSLITPRFRAAEPVRQNADDSPECGEPGDDPQEAPAAPDKADD